MDNEVIVLSDNSDDDVMAVPNATPTAAPNAPPTAAPNASSDAPPTAAPDDVSKPVYPPGRVIAKIQPTEILPLPPDAFEDDEIQITSVTNNKTREGTKVSTAASESRADQECIPIGERQGIRPNRDYPHFRFTCDTFPFKKVRARTKELFCDFCYCYICDVLASDCTKWSVHCKVLDNQKSKRERDVVLTERKRRQLSNDEARCTLLKRITRPQPVHDFEYEHLVELPNDEEEFEDDGCPHSASEDEQPSMPIDFDHGHLMHSIQRVRIAGKGSKLERMVDTNPHTETYVTFRQGVSAYADLL
eukprot:gb/GEZJ01002875.1/.p1 GENE.gb/GEZJ01002875.1/~~gb/GEZJ01002875.1/.p1  ORF type:complete len:304 (-),score=49.84 gb/GEZJ01002875.1/:2413-3324(-)